MSIYSEDIGHIKATLEQVVEIQTKQQEALDMLMADAAFRRKLAVIGKTIVFISIAVATLRIGDIKGLF